MGLDSRSYLLGAGSMLLLTACAGVAFPYKYYGLSAETYKGALVGVNPGDDLTLDRCTPTKADDAPCIVMLKPDFLLMKKDYKDTKTQLISCEKRP